MAAAGESGALEEGTDKAGEWQAVWESSVWLKENEARPGGGCFLAEETSVEKEEKEDENTGGTVLAVLFATAATAIETPLAGWVLVSGSMEETETVHPTVAAARETWTGSGSGAELTVQRNESGGEGQAAMTAVQQPTFLNTPQEDAGGLRFATIIEKNNFREESLRPDLHRGESGREPAHWRLAQTVADVVLQPAARSAVIRASHHPSPSEAGREPQPGVTAAAPKPQAPRVESAWISATPAVAGRAGDTRRSGAPNHGQAAGGASPADGAAEAAAIEPEPPHGLSGQQQREEADALPAQGGMMRESASLARGGEKESPVAAPQAPASEGAEQPLPASWSSEGKSGPSEATGRPVRDEAVAGPRAEAGNLDAAGAEIEPAGNRLPGQLDLQLEGRAGERVRIRLAEAPGGVRLRMASNDARLAESLRSQWQTLEAALRNAGWRTQPEASGPADSVQAGGRWMQGHPGLRWGTEGVTTARAAEPAAVQDPGMGPQADGQPRQGREGAQDGQDGMRQELEDLSALRRLGRRR